MSNVTQQQKAYDAGVQDGILTGVQPTDLKFIQDFNEYDGETLVCYLNGCGDGVFQGSAIKHALRFGSSVLITKWEQNPFSELQKVA